jgi:CRISPR-associated protein Cas5d
MASRKFCLEVSGDFACFTRPEMKVERVSYDVITPSAARAIFESILWKPAVRWEIEQIEVLHTIRWINLRRNEVGKKIPMGTVKSAMKQGRGKIGINIEDERQQRAGLFLRDVHYRLHATLVFLSEHDPGAEPGKYYAIFERRASKGQCFNQPYLGCREFAAHFTLVDAGAASTQQTQPIEEDRDLGWMLYDLDYQDANDPQPRFFHAKMQQGVVQVPAWDSEEVRG